MIRKARKEELPEILAVYAAARAFMAKTGNPNQWGNHHPPKELLEKDIEIGQLYVSESDGKVHGAFAFIEGPDPTYSYIENGKWISDEPYYVIHRIASDGTEKGLLRRAVAFADAVTTHLRIDTHEENTVMQNAIAKCGFTRCGIIYLENGDPRIAYEKL